MTVETPTSTAAASSSAASSPLLVQLLENLSSSSKAIESGDESAVNELVNFLNSITDDAMCSPENDVSINNAFEFLSQVHRFLLSHELEQATIDVLSFELLKPVARMSGLSYKFLEIANGIVDHFIASCTPRDMLSFLCEALDGPKSTINSSGYVAPLLNGIAKVLPSIQRRQFEHLKETVQIILKVLKDVRTTTLDDNAEECVQLFGRAIDIADYMLKVCSRMEGSQKEKLQALLGLYVLQIMGLVSVSIRHHISRCLDLVSRMSCFLPYCGLSYLGLITGSDIDNITTIIERGEEDGFGDCFSLNKLGAAISVISGHLSNDVAMAAGEDMCSLKNELQSNHTTRWQAIGMLKYIFSSDLLSWQLKEHAIDFVLCITSGDNIARTCDYEHSDYSSYMPGICTALQGIIMVIIYSPSAVPRKKAFGALRRVLADSPSSQKLDLFRVLIANSDSSSMIAILLDLFRGELYTENCKRTTKEKSEVLQSDDQEWSTSSLWTAGVLELVALVLWPLEGEPPLLHEASDGVLAALNLYRFVIMTESAGGTNYTGVLSSDNLRRAYNEWLLPLRVLVNVIKSESCPDSDPDQIDAVCALNPVELVLHRCIELVEQSSVKLKCPLSV